VPANFVSRDQLRAALDELGAEFPISLVCAPAGYGKTLLLADWIEKTGAVDKAWVSLDSGDNDADRFWTGVLRALRECESVPASSPLHRLDPPDASDPGFLAEVIDALAVLPDPVYLVLDDVHELISDATWHGIDILVRHQPANARIVLSTRVDPPLPLARLRVQGRLAELRANELRFTDEQAAELLRLADIGLDDDQIHRLVAQTDGWPAGLRLAARSLRDVPDHEAFLAEFAGNDRAVADFLVSEVLARFSTETTDVLARVSVCDEVTPALAAELTGHEDAGAILTGLERDSSLVLAVGADRQWFRTHPLLRAYLLADLARQHPGTVPELHETAAAWFAAQEQPDKAFDHVSLTDETRTIVALLRQSAMDVLLTGDDPRSVRRALVKVGDEVVAADPWLSLISALAYLVVGEHGLAAVDLAATWAAWPDDAEAELARLHQLVLATRAFTEGLPPPVGSADRRDIIVTQDGSALECWATVCVGWARLRAGDHARARQELEAAERVARDQGLDFLTMHTLSMRGVLSCQDGDVTAMDAAAGEAITIAATHGWTASPWLVADHLMIGLARLLRLEPAAALAEARQAAAAQTMPAEPHLTYMIDMLAGAAHFDAGRQQDGWWLIREARRALGEASVPARVRVAGALIEQRCALALGQDPHAASRWLRQWVGDIAEVSLMHALALFARGDTTAAEAALRGVLTESRPALCPTTKLEARLLETALEIRNDRRTGARAALGAALTLAAPATLIRPFHQADLPVRHLLLELVGGFDGANEFVTRVGHAVSAMAGSADGGLTHREHAVFVLLSSPRTIVEMAAQLSVSANTIKSHVRAIYSKLGVNSRRAAVVAGRQLGID
jgi:LuxR family transcriptional regulator, maltose regulon positive regulatory protein